jgi:hypothetical protein
MTAKDYLEIGAQLCALVAGLASALGTVRNLLTHLGWISTKTDSRLHKIADRMSWISEKGKKGLVGIASLPGVASKDFALPGELSKFAFLPIFFAAAAALASGCAHGTDGLRQTCSNTDRVLAGVAGFAEATVKTDLPALRAQLPALGVAARLRAHELAFGKAVSSLDAARSSKDAVCALAPAIDAGMKADVGGLIGQVAAIALDAQKVYEQLREVLK